MRLRGKVRVRVGIAGPPPQQPFLLNSTLLDPRHTPMPGHHPLSLPLFLHTTGHTHLTRRFPLTTPLAPHSQPERVRQPPAEGEHATSHACLLCGRRAAQNYGGAISATASSHVTVAEQSTLSGNSAVCGWVRSTCGRVVIGRGLRLR